MQLMMVFSSDAGVERSPGPTCSHRCPGKGPGARWSLTCSLSLGKTNLWDEDLFLSLANSLDKVLDLLKGISFLLGYQRFSSC